MRRLAATGLLLGLVAFVPLGCTGVEPAVIGVAASTGQTAAGVFGKGRIASVHARELEVVTEVVRREIADLGLTITDDRPLSGEGRWLIRAVDNHDDWIRFEFDARSPVLTRLEINVGWHGHEPTATLLFQGILQRLKARGVYGFSDYSATRPATMPAR